MITYNSSVTGVIRIRLQGCHDRSPRHVRIHFVSCFTLQTNRLMAITQQDVDRIAQLAYLELTPEQTKRAQSEFADILALIQKLQSVETRNIEPMAHPLSGHQDVVLRLRDDTPRPAATLQERDALMRNAPATADGVFLVPTVIE